MVYVVAQISDYIGFTSMPAWLAQAPYYCVAGIVIDAGIILCSRYCAKACLPARYGPLYKR